MDLTFLDKLLWAASFIGNVALFLVLLVRGRWRQFPVITGYMAFQNILTGLLYEIYRYGSPRLYSVAYWTSDIFDFIFQLGLMFEISRVVLKPTGTWVRDAKWIFLSLAAIVVPLATILALLVKPPTLGFLEQWEIRSQLFTSLLICELFLIVMMASNHLGLVWRNHVMGLGQGLSAFGLVSLFVDGAHCIGPFRYYTKLEHVKIASYLIALVYWMITFWRQEPQRKELTPEMQAFLASFHRSARQDLSSVVVHTQHHE
jgi:hypothetical protein